MWRVNSQLDLSCPTTGSVCLVVIDSTMLDGRPLNCAHAATRALCRQVTAHTAGHAPATPPLSYKCSRALLLLWRCCTTKCRSTFSLNATR
jgi:hypothetical protein